MTLDEAVALLREARAMFAVIADETTESECECPPDKALCPLCGISGMANNAKLRIDAALAKAEKPAAEPPIGNCRLCGPRTREQTIGAYGGGVKLVVCSHCFGPIRGADGEPLVEKLRGGE